MSNRLYSIIISVYNVMPYLKQCLNSVAAQSLKDFELIIVNDGSTDDSRDYCDSFAREHPSIPTTIVDKHNGGPLHARLSGLKHAKGKYILTLDGDDGLREDALAKISSFIFSYDPDVVCFDYSRNEDYSSPRPKLYDVPTLLSGNELVPLLKILCTTSKLNSIWGKAFKNKYNSVIFPLAKLGRMQYGEDLLQSAAILSQAEKVAYLPEALYYYRWNPDSLMNHVDQNKLLTRYNDMKESREYLRKFAHGFDSKYTLHHDFVNLTYRYDCVELYRLMQAAASCGVDFFCRFAKNVSDDQFFAAAYDHGLDGARLDMRRTLRLIKRGDYISACQWISLIKRVSRQWWS